MGRRLASGANPESAEVQGLSTLAFRNAPLDIVEAPPGWDPTPQYWGTPPPSPFRGGRPRPGAAERTPHRPPGTGGLVCSACCAGSAPGDARCLFPRFGGTVGGLAAERSLHPPSITSAKPAPSVPLDEQELSDGVRTRPTVCSYGDASRLRLSAPKRAGGSSPADRAWRAGLEAPR